MAPPLLLLSEIVLRFGGEPLLNGAELSVLPGERLCLVGRNGSGKSTLLRIAAGLIDTDSGKRFLQPGTTVRYLPQEPDLLGFATTLAYAEDGLAPGDDPHRARYLLERLGLTGNENPATLSGGEKRRTALARVLAPSPDIMLLDEPTNHLDLPSIEWLETELKSSPSALVLISHDRRFLESVSRNIIWLERGRTRRLNDGFNFFEAWRDKILETEAIERHKLDRKIARETHWLHHGVTARRKRNMGRLRALQDLREQRRSQDGPDGSITLTTALTRTPGKRLIEVNDISKSFGDASIVKDFSTRILRGDRVGIIGPNGAGKTTLLNMLTGALKPDSGTITLGTSIEMASLEQSRQSLANTMTLQDALTGGSGDSVTIGGQQRHVISYMKDFLFQPEQARTQLSALSGGERGRLMLARALVRPANLLVLDEPTNDLDIETLDLLQEMLADFTGTVLLVSHDRDFLDRVVTSVIHFEGDSRWLEYAGGYSDMEAQRRGLETELQNKGEVRKRPRLSSKTKSDGGTPERPSKLSFKDKHALEILPKTIVGLEDELVQLQVMLADPDLYAHDPGAFRTASDRFEEVSEALAKSEEDWLRLEILREELEGG